MAKNQLAGYVTFKHIVHSFLNEKNIYRVDPNQYTRILNVVLEGFIDLNMFHINNVKVAYLQPNSRGIYELPLDYLKYTKIGVPVGNSIRTLTLNTEMIIGDSANCETLDAVKTVKSVEGVTRADYAYTYIDHYKEGNLIEGAYSQGGGYNDAYYRVNHSERTMTIDGRLGSDYVILEYKSTGVDPCADTTVPRQALKCLKAYVDWRIEENDDTKGQSSKDRKMSLYHMAVEELRSLENLFTMDEFLDAMAETYMQTPIR